MLHRVLPRAGAAIIALAALGAFAAPATAEFTKFGDRALREGDHGRHVRVLQRWMKVVGYPIKVDGAYGGKTTRMVRRYERDNQMRVNGRVSHGVCASASSGRGSPPRPRSRHRRRWR